jgi:acetyl esterase/lipase
VTAGLPAHIIAQLRAADPEDIPAQVTDAWGLLTPYHEKLGYTAPRLARDLAYGTNPRQRLDLHAAADRDRPAPVVLFVHGGGFIGGDKHVPGMPMYDHVGAWAVRRGAVGVTMTYRLAPDHRWPAGAEDVAAAVRWVREHIADFGGDPERIVVAGHSAGAAHAASFLAGHGGGSLDGVCGGALLSGIYDLANRGGLERAYYGDLPAETVSSLPGLIDCPIPLLFSVAERDPRYFHAQAAELVAAWLARHGSTPHLLWVEGHNHISEIASIGVDEDALGTQLGRFIDRVTGPA